ncbi:UNVERIFIED_CONTAM: hypothetical protein GTU68_064648 [Idotea baltica]|nr:hypothetical protein [Idotea baltica]
MTLCRDYNIPATKVPLEKINRVTRKNHQGTVAFISAITYASLDHIISSTFEKGETPLLLILDRVTDVRNFGAIARSAECAGAHGIIIPSHGSAQINSDAMKTSAGALNYIPVYRSENLKKTLREIQENGIQLVACTEKASEALYDQNLTDPVALIMGSEEDGISHEFLRIADHMCKLPIKGKIQSLNVGVAASIALLSKRLRLEEMRKSLNIGFTHLTFIIANFDQQL